MLAFANLSDDKENEYFSDGISEELLNVPAKIPELKVTARTSAFYFKGQNAPIPEIAEKLGVAYVVEGSVRKSGNRVRITAQLIKAMDGFHVWSDTFTHDLKDIFAVQDEIAGLMANNLQLKMGVAPAGPRREVNPEAHRLVLEGRHFWNLRADEGFGRAEAAFRKRSSSIRVSRRRMRDWPTFWGSGSVIRRMLEGPEFPWRRRGSKPSGPSNSTRRCPKPIRRWASWTFSRVTRRRRSRIFGACWRQTRISRCRITGWRCCWNRKARSTRRWSRSIGRSNSIR